MVSELIVRRARTSMLLLLLYRDEWLGLLCVRSGRKLGYSGYPMVHTIPGDQHTLAVTMVTLEVEC